MKQVVTEMKLSVPFRTICSQCKKELNFSDKKYADPGNSDRCYCEDCKQQSEK